MHRRRPRKVTRKRSEILVEGGDGDGGAGGAAAGGWRRTDGRAGERVSERGAFFYALGNKAASNLSTCSTELLTRRREHPIRGQ